MKNSGEKIMGKDKITIMQIQSPIGRQSDQRKTLIGLV